MNDICKPAYICMRTRRDGARRELRTAATACGAEGLWQSGRRLRHGGGERELVEGLVRGVVALGPGAGVPSKGLSDTSHDPLSFHLSFASGQSNSRASSIMAKSPHEAMAYVQQSLTGEASIADRLQCVQRLRVVALALGEEKTRTELLPFLRKLRDPPVRPCPRWRSRALRRSPASEKYAGSAPLFLGVAAPPRSGAATSCTAVPPVGLLEPTLLIFPARAAPLVARIRPAL